MTEAHLQRTPRDVREMLHKLLAEGRGGEAADAAKTANGHPVGGTNGVNGSANGNGNGHAAASENSTPAPQETVQV